MPEPMSCRAGVALVIGVGQYLRAERVERLRFATRDAVALGGSLADPALCAFPSDQVVVLTDGEARRDEVVQRLSRWLPERARNTDLVVIYFAGHGMVQTVGRREEGFLLPYDADPDDVVTRGVAMSDLARWIDGLDARAVVVCLDCCHAGKVLGQRDSSSSGRNMELRPAVLQGMTGRGRYLIASCDEGQKSFECADLGHGLFTYHLLQGIAGAADSDGDGRVGLAELFNYVSREVARDAWQRFGCEQKPWTSATWAEETYISSPTARTTIGTTVSGADSFERLWREQGAAAALREIEQTLPQADEEGLRRALRFLGRVKEPGGIPVIFRCLAHASEAVRGDARSALHAFDWAVVVAAVEGIARGGDPAATFLLDGLNAFEAHPRVVDLLNRLVLLLQGDLRNRAILLWRRKQLVLELGHVADLFREIRSPYQIQKVLGEGLFTASYLARDEYTGLEVVVRVLRPEFACQPHVSAQFLDLARQSVYLVHEKLALTREVRPFPERSIYFAVRDYIPGVTLQRALEMGKRFAPPQIGRILRDVAEALTPLHRKVVCHGGIKPSNIFLCEGDRVVLGDPSQPVQGIGVALDRLSYDYRYCPPEMFQGGGVLGPQSDFYALGCVAYELLCGAPPFVSDNFHELAARHIKEMIAPPSHRGSPLGVEGDAVILKLLTRSPAERYATLEEVLQALASLQHTLEGPASRDLLLARPLLHDASLMNYQGGQSILNFEQTGGPRTESLGAGPSDLAVSEQPPPQIPGFDIEGDLAISEQPPPQIPGFDIEEMLGQGGMGVVYKARDVQLNRVVALKVLRAGPGIAVEQLVRFRREAESVARLQHPNIVQIHRLIEHQGLTCLALEYVGGGNLRQRMQRGGPMLIRDAAALTVTLARAVEYAHHHGVLHRDLKPSNILLTPEELPKIADFGLAKRLGESPDAGDLTHSGQVLGTPAYMSPEQADTTRGKVNIATDVYALGTMFYEMLTGRRPFAGADSLELLLRIKSEKPTPPRRLRSEIPRDLESVCLRCLEKDPARRYARAADLADDLERWLQGDREEVLCSGGFWRRLLRLLFFRK
jgi:serine/threonine protein kinase